MTALTWEKISNHFKTLIAGTISLLHILCYVNVNYLIYYSLATSAFVNLVFILIKIISLCIFSDWKSYLFVI